MKKVDHVFATFPKFSKLTLEDRDVWEDLVADYPPISDISFPAMMTWWNSLGAIRVSQLNDNLILSYWMPGDEKNSGLSIVGTKKVDETICSIFDYLKERGEEPRLVHVPEFVLQNVQFPEMYACKGERAYDECILQVKKFAVVENIPLLSRRRIRRFLINHGEEGFSVKQLDLSQSQNKQALLDAHERWKNMSPFNKLNQAAEEAMYEYIHKADKIGVENLCFYFNGQLHAYILFSWPASNKYALTTFGAFSFERPGLFEFAGHKFAQWFDEQGVEYLNIDIDWGNIAYRSLQLMLGPSHFFRKYTIKPV